MSKSRENDQMEKCVKMDLKYSKNEITNKKHY